MTKPLKPIERQIALLNEVRTLASAEYNNRVPQATKANLAEVETIVTTYPTVKNEFIDVLTNQVARSIYLSKFYNNPFKEFKKGTLDYGKTIESVFVDLIKAKDFKDNFGSANTDVSSLIGVEPTDNVKVEYYSENYRNKYKISVSDMQLKGAFRNSDGLYTLIQELYKAPLTSAEFDEYLMMKTLICNGSFIEQTIPKATWDALDEQGKSKDLTKRIKTLVNKFKFLSDQFNKQGVHTFSNPEDIVIFVTPETQAMLDVEFLSFVFHLDKAEVNAKIKLIDEFVKKGEGGKVETDEDTLCIIADKDMIQVYDTLNEVRNFENPDQLVTNTFYHRWGIMAICNFVNAVKIKVGEATPEATPEA